MTSAAQVIFAGGPVITMDDRVRTAEAVAVADGRIVAVGTERDVMSVGGPDTEVVDLAGCTLMPAFIDAHGHFMNALQVVQWANIQGTPAGPITCTADVWTVLEEHVERHDLPPGEWIIGYGYDRCALEGGREITADDIDEHFPDHPVMLIHSSNHGAVLNRVAFEIVGYDETTPTPPSGVIARKEGSDEPAGLIMETAFLPIFAAMPKPAEPELLDLLDAAQQIYARAGVATCQEGATFAENLAFLRTAADQGRFYLDVVSLPLIVDVPELVKEYFPSFSGDPMELPDEAVEAFGTYENRLKLQGIKFIVDGSPQGKTAYWTEPLETGGPAGEPDHCGHPLFPAEDIHHAMAEVYDQGIQVFCHANGDAAIDLLIEGARSYGVDAADDRRTVVIHSQCMRPDQLDAYVELGFSPSFFTVHTFYWGDVHVANLGELRAGFISPMWSAAAKGLRCSNHTDFSVTPMEPMRMIWSAITRRSRSGRVIGPAERVDRWQALKALTIEAAWQLFEEDDKGTLEPGKLADLVVLDGNPLTVGTDEILDIDAVRTYKEGRIVFDRHA